MSGKKGSGHSRKKGTVITASPAHQHPWKDRQRHPIDGAPRPRHPVRGKLPRPGANPITYAASLAQSRALSPTRCAVPDVAR